jgi:hypothetical protein
VNPTLHEHFPAVQFPCEEQTRGFVELIPKQILNSHSYPVYPRLQLQFPGSEQFPCDEQASVSEEFFPKQILKLH